MRASDLSKARLFFNFPFLNFPPFGSREYVFIFFQELIKGKMHKGKW